MKCESWMPLIEQRADGELDERAAWQVDQHLAACRSCAAFLERLRAEQAVYARYERDVEVTPAIWAAVEAKIREEPAQGAVSALARLRQWLSATVGAPRLSPAMAAVLVIIAVGVTLGVISLKNSGPAVPPNGVASNGSESNTPATPPSGPPGVKPPSSNPLDDVTAASKGSGTAGPRGRAGSRASRNPTPAQLVREAEQKYLTAIAILSRDVRHRRSNMDPIVLARFDSALGDIDRVIAETRRAVRQNPGDPIALHYLLAAYSKKVDALREMATD
ncbi:MAG TPA: zf-HC2 domain-containing protein [Blastocatellia bacterium]|nr:zf-HC2 domain-containing protein [Blastocatellia bacterium]